MSRLVDVCSSMNSLINSVTRPGASNIGTCPTPSSTVSGVQNVVVLGIDWRQAANNDPSSCDNDPGGSDVGDVSDTNRRVKTYTLTGQGRKQLRAELSRWDRFAGAVTRALQTRKRTV